ncbi:hypothetical protein IHN63_06595 [Deinococcus sp. 6YEL10]|uniref:hypothetical protein n=1 Tax=Deinococcus sp. 6YEL10 TaxID=2745870 RepID=UPI001E3B9840|nr:hypothetical protein [Deinococcus sp. 6YEL10]MCD0160978.1 hypothetical protein [Deinococcus sp. 6YEL10]
MRKTLLLAAALAMPATASAQTWTLDEPTASLVLKGCYVVKDGVRCDYTYTMTGTASAEVSLYESDFKVVTPNGETLNGKSISVGGSSFFYRGIQRQVFRNAPVQVSVMFDLPNTTSSFRALAYEDEAAMNVPVARSAAATTPVVTTPAPSAAIPTGFSLALNDCKVNQGVYTCTAVLTPTR